MPTVGTTVPAPPIRGEESPIFSPIKFKIFSPFRYAHGRSWGKKFGIFEKRYKRVHGYVLLWQYEIPGSGSQKAAAPLRWEGNP